MSSNKASAYIRVYGIVQGVGYRFFTEDIAQSLGITGYVRNCLDGTVEVYAEGDKSKIITFIEYLKQGPRAARVTNIELKWNDTPKGYQKFTIMY